MIYDLSNSEKEIIVSNRLDNLNIFAKRNGTKFSLCSINNGSCICALTDELSGNMSEIILDNEELDKIYEFLKERHKLIKELEYLKSAIS